MVLNFIAEHVRAIGVSNFSIGHLEEMLEYCSVVPQVNQVEFHPYQNPKQLHLFCIENDIHLEARIHWILFYINGRELFFI